MRRVVVGRRKSNRPLDCRRCPQSPERNLRLAVEPRRPVTVQTLNDDAVAVVIHSLHRGFCADGATGKRGIEFLHSRVTDC